jgi:acylphosphatase
METVSRARIEVSGRVQGVGFRYHTFLKATGLGLSGFVRNQPDGSVYIEAQGEPGAVRQLIEWCHSGPTRADVSAVDYSFLQPGDYSSFQIR